MHDEPEDHDLGLSHDLPRILERQAGRQAERQAERNVRMGRRGMLGVFGAAGVAALAVSCGTDESPTKSGSSAPAGTPNGPPDQGGAGAPGAAGGPETTVDVAEGEIPEETAGPYPGDGSNGANVLNVPV